MIKDLKDIRPVFFDKIKVKKYQIIQCTDTKNSLERKEEFYKAIIRIK